MSGFGDIVSEGTALLHEALGEPALYTPAGGVAVATDIVLHEPTADRANLPGFALRESQLSADVLRAACARPARGDAFEFTASASASHAGRRFRVDAVIAGDADQVTVAVQELP